MAERVMIGVESAAWPNFIHVDWSGVMSFFYKKKELKPVSKSRRKFPDHKKTFRNVTFDTKSRDIERGYFSGYLIPKSKLVFFEDTQKKT